MELGGGSCCLEMLQFYVTLRLLMNSSKMLYQIISIKGNNVLTSVSTLSLTFPGNDDSLDDSTQYDDAAAR